MTVRGVCLAALALVASACLVQSSALHDIQNSQEDGEDLTTIGTEPELGETVQSAPAAGAYQAHPLIGTSKSAIDNNTAVLTMKDTSLTFDTAVNATQVCGDGKRVGTEQCDDGNLAESDGCSKTCQVEGGYGCEPGLLDGSGDTCRACQNDECTIFYNKQFQCLSTKPSFYRGKKRQPTHQRAPSGFCECAENHCREEGTALCRPAKEGWTANSKGICECGLGRCLMPYAKQTIASSSKYHCFKMNKNMIRNVNTSLCECSAGSPEVVSDDPAVAKRFTFPACKGYPATPLKRIRYQGPVYAAFSCKSAPYLRSNTSEFCGGCEPGACKMPRNGVSWPAGTPQDVKNPFFCVSKEKMNEFQMSVGTEGFCQCKADECLIPYRDTYKCAPLDGSHPYGGTKLKNGRCGCAADADACIMPTSKPSNTTGNATPGFMCLRLKNNAGAETRYGKKYFRGNNGECRCQSDRCKTDALPKSVGAFRCLKYKKRTAYTVDLKALAAVKAGTGPEDVQCQCAPGTCTLPLDGSGIKRCVKCPSRPGSCRSKCVNMGKSTKCVRHCSTQHVTMKPKPEIGYGEMFKKKNFQARVTRCFITKVVDCKTKSAASKARECTQSVTARVLFDCPGRYSKRASRKLMDGSETHGYKSVCSRQNYECQKEKCNPGASAALCLQKMLLS